QLLVYSADERHRLRPFTELDNEDHGELWTPIVPSDDIVIEVAIPDAVAGDLDLELTHIGHGYRGFGALLGGPAARSGSCNVDVVCPEGDDWRDEISTVGVISTGGSTFCTGFMVNNTAYDLTPYFMTADHCGISAGNAASLVVYWNYENSWCRTPGSPESGGPGDGSLSEFQTGSFFRAEYGSSDFTLVLLDDDPDPDWQVGFAGWDRGPGDALSAVAIHHPNTDEKRISFEDDPTTTTGYLGNTVPGDGTHVRVEDWDLGTTEPGSSGSPLFNQDHQVIGQLHGGYASCTSQTSDWYGRFSVSWDGGGSPSTRLADWLDAAGTGATTVDTISGLGMSITPSGDVLSYGEVGGPFTDPTVTYTLSNPSPAPIDYAVSLTSSFGMLLDGGTGPVTGTLAAGGGSAQVDVTLGPDIYGLGAGVYKETINFDDLTNVTTKTRQHWVEIGQTLYSVAPDTGLTSSGPLAGPFPDTQVYTVTSERPTPVQVEVSASDSWIALNGGAGPVIMELAGTGDWDDVIVGFSVEAEALPNGLYEGSVMFTNLSGGPGGTTRDVTLDVGRIVYHSTDTPQSIVDNSTTTSYFEVLDDWCIGDVDVDVDISHTYIGDLIVELTSPVGTTVRLHNRTGGTSEDIVTRYDDDGEGTPPDGPGTLSSFDFESSAGVWTLTVSDNAGADQGTLNSWALRMSPVAGDCPTPQLVHAFPLETNPGWTTEGQWAWGQPTGGGGASGNPDPTSGHTGLYVYGYNLNGDYPDNMPEYHLTSTAIDCSEITGTRLRFWRWLGVEQPAYDHAFVRVSNDGTSWVTVWENTGSIADSAWTLQSFDVSGVADGQPTVYVRWTMGQTDGSVRYCGWNLDDVEIWGVLPSCSGDINEDGTVNVEDFLAMIAEWGPCPGCASDLDGDGSVNVTDFLDLLAAWGPCP
ncbi:MAG: proprotein convertase P-domain-containing protein, partial [Planctomycetota bacterium]